MNRRTAPRHLTALAALALAPAVALAVEEGKGRPAEAPPRGAKVRFAAEYRRDPFLNPVLTRKKADEMNVEVAPEEIPPGISGTYIAQAKLLGIVLRDGAKTAVLQATDQRAYFMREGERLLDGFIRRIEADSVLFVRETKYRSGKVSSEEVVKHLRIP